MTAWIGVIGAIMGAVIGSGLSLISVRFQLRHQMTRERYRLVLSKLEELYQVIADFRIGYRAKTAKRFEGFRGANEIPIDFDYPHTQISTVPVERIQMLVGFYAPELLEEVEEIGRCQTRYQPALVACDKLVGSTNPTEILPTLVTLDNTWQQLDKACAAMQGRVAAIARDYL